jgi:hypothetical protein
MIHFFENQSKTVFAVQTQNELSSEDCNKLNWLFGNAHKIEKSVLADFFVGPRAAMITPWSTNAVWHTLWDKHGSITRNKAWEFNGYRAGNLITVGFHWTLQGDHAGVHVMLGLFGYETELHFYDTRHWNYDTNTWECYQ